MIFSDFRFNIFITRRIASLLYFCCLVASLCSSVVFSINFTRGFVWDLSYMLPTFLAGPAGVLAFLVVTGISVLLSMLVIRILFELTLSLIVIADKISSIEALTKGSAE